MAKQANDDTLVTKWLDRSLFAAAGPSFCGGVSGSGCRQENKTELVGFQSDDPGKTKAPADGTRSLFQSHELNGHETGNDVTEVPSVWRAFVESASPIDEKEQSQRDFRTQQISVSEVSYADLAKATDNFNESLWTEESQEGRLLGAGSFGKVFFAQLTLEGEKMMAAVKKFKQAKDNKPSRELVSRRQFFSEMNSLARCDHPNIVKLLAYCVNAPELCIVYQFVLGGTLTKALSKNNPSPLCWKERLSIAQGIADALNYLHTKCGVIHRDVKTANLLLDKDKMVKIADFGLSIYLDCENGSSFSLSASVGTKCYMSPEALKGKVSTKVDVYAFGMVLYEIVTGLPPYSHSKKSDLITYIKDLEEQEDDLEEMIDPRLLKISESTRTAHKLFEIARRCCAWEYKTRPSMEEVLCQITKVVGEHF